jgi:hypothetical protein
MQRYLFSEYMTLLNISFSSIFSNRNVWNATLLVWRYKKHFNRRKLWKDMENTEENSEKIWKLWKKGTLNSEKIWKIWKKLKLNSDKIWKIQKKIVKRFGKYRRK